MRQTLKYCFWMIFILLLAACTPNTTILTPTQKVDTNVSSTPVIFQMTPTAINTPTSLSTEILTSKPTQRRSSTRTPLTPYTVEGLHAVYSMKGNLYMQESGGQPTQLTKSSGDHNALLSDDGQKVVFYRGNSFFIEQSEVYSVNADGSHEKALVTNALLIALGLGYNESTELESLAFVPGTHQLLFNTHQINGIKGGTGGTTPNNDLLIVNTDSAKISLLRSPRQAGYFKVAPNGKLVAIQTSDHIDIIDINGQVIHPNLVTYSEDDDHIGIPFFWTGDSSQLIVMLPLPSTENIFNHGWPLLRSTWKYSLNGSQPTEAQLNPAPMGDVFSPSPDGNWMAYSYYYQNGKTDENGKFGIYLGNLHTGVSQLLYQIPVESGELPSVYHWNSASTNFIVEGYELRFYFGDIQGNATTLAGKAFHGWLDSNRYLYDSIVMGEVGKDEKVSILQIPSGQLFAFVLLKH